MLPLRGAARARNISSPYISQYIYRTGYVLAFKRGCYWIMNVPKRPKFRMRGEHYFRRGSNNFVRFYITRPRSQRCARVSSSTCATCWKVHTFDRGSTYVLRDRPRPSFLHLLLIAKFALSPAKAALWNAWCALRIILLTWDVKM